MTPSGSSGDLLRYPDRGLHGRAVDDLGMRIVRGDFAAGETLDLLALSQRYDTSRGGVREALRVLSGKGLIDARPKRGTFVTERNRWNLLDPDVLRWQLVALPSPKLLEKLTELRVMIEPAAAALAAQRRDDADLAEIAAALTIMDVEDGSEDAASIIVTGDVRFHRAVLAATHNELIEQLGHIIAAGLRSRDEYVHMHDVSIKNGWHEHESVLRAIEGGAPEAARLAMLGLVESAAADATEVLARETAVSKPRATRSATNRRPKVNH